MDELKFAMRGNGTAHPVPGRTPRKPPTCFFTGGDPMVMSYKVFNSFIEPILADTNKTNIQTIRIGTKSLAYWPYKFLTDKDADQFIDLFERIVQKGINLAFMAHFNHPAGTADRSSGPCSGKDPCHRCPDTHPVACSTTSMPTPDIWAEM